MPDVFNCPTDGCPVQGLVVKIWPLHCVCGVYQAGPTDAPIPSTKAYAKKPSLIRRALSYAREKLIWESAGRPLRTPAERKHLFENKCLKCPHFIKEKDDAKKGGVCGYCSLCGCPIKQKAGDLNDKLSWATTKCPDDRWGEPVQVVYGIRHPSKSWYDLCGNIPAKLLADNGITAVVESLNNDKIHTRDLIADHKPKIFINVAMALSHSFVHELAELFPDTKFVTVNHSSQAHLVSTANWIPQQLGHLLAMRERANCYFATPDERNVLHALTDDPKCLHMPNVVRPIEPAIKPLGDIVGLSLVGRWDSLKNIPNQIIASGLANKVLQCKVTGCFYREQKQIMSALTRLAGVDYRSFPWGSIENYTKMLRDTIDIGLQVSFTESFTFVALEHLMSGKPVVGSQAVRYLPAKWQAKSDDAEDIARIILEITDDYDNAAKEAAEIGASYAKKCNAKFIGTIQTLLE